MARVLKPYNPVADRAVRSQQAHLAWRDRSFFEQNYVITKLRELGDDLADRPIDEHSAGRRDALRAAVAILETSEGRHRG